MSVTDTQAVQAPRAKLNLDFGEDDAPSIPTPKADVEKKVQEIGEKTGFSATSTPVRRIPIGEKVKKTVEEAKRPSRKRAKTGRTHPFNTKIKIETYDELCMIADSATQEEGRPVSLAEVLERAVEALKNQRAA